jgi:hypothetical protein
MKDALTKDALWLRALRAADGRGLLPSKRSSLTPRELAAVAAWRGERRLSQLVDGWYYPRSYGHIRGALTDEQAGGIVAALEAETQSREASNARTETEASIVERPAKPRITYCALCGQPLVPRR